MIPHPCCEQEEEAPGVPPLTEADLASFLADLAALPADTVVGHAVSLEHCVTAQWYSGKVQAPIFASILKHFLSLQALERDDWEYNPPWVIGIELAADRCFNAGSIPAQYTQEQFFRVVLPYARRLESALDAALRRREEGQA